MRPGDHAEDFFPISSHLLLALWLLRLAHQQPQIYWDDRFGILRTQLSSGHADIDRMQRAGHRKVAISGVLPRSGLGWLSSRDRGVLPTSLFGGLFLTSLTL